MYNLFFPLFRSISLSLLQTLHILFAKTRSWYLHPLIPLRELLCDSYFQLPATKFRFCFSTTDHSWCCFGSYISIRTHCSVHIFICCFCRPHIYLCLLSCMLFLCTAAHSLEHSLSNNGEKTERENVFLNGFHYCRHKHTQTHICNLHIEEICVLKWNKSFFYRFEVARSIRLWWGIRIDTLFSVFF